MTIDNPPAFSTWVPNTLTIAAGTTVAADAGNHTVAMSVCDEHDACTTGSFIITIN